MKVKHCLVTILESNEGLARLLGTELQRLGLDVSAHFWTPGTDALGALIAELSREEMDGWLIAGLARNLADPKVMRELSLAMLGAQAAHGIGFPVVIAPDGGAPTTLPTPFMQASVASHAPAAKMAARLYGTRSQLSADYRLCVHCLPGLGVWLELGPRREPWRGAFLGVLGKDAAGKAVVPVAHGVGLAGRIPERSTLEYPVQGMRIAAAQGEFEAWGVHNALTCDLSYYVKLSDIPDALTFGAFPEEDAPETYMLRLTN